MVRQLNTADFKDKIFDYANEKQWLYQNDKPSIIKFGANWCQPCKQLDPVLEELSRDYTGKVDIFNVDIEDDHELAQAFAIKSIPSMLFIPMGDSQPQMMMGGLPKNKVKEGILDILKVEI